jgi:hypothetical protein
MASGRCSKLHSWEVGPGLNHESILTPDFHATGS